MKRVFFTIVLLCFVSLSGFGHQKDTIRILAIGNSFSEDSVNQYFHEIAAADGQVTIVGNLYIGGCTLERHYDNMISGKKDYVYYKISAEGKLAAHKNSSLERGVLDEKWDVITLQQASGYSGLLGSYEPWLSELVTYLSDRVPDARIMWHQTWAYAKNSTHNHFMHYDCDQLKMYEGIVKCSSYACNKYGFGIIPTGTAVQTARRSPMRENVTRDGFHLSYIFGRYIASCTWYEAITGRSVLGNAYSPEGLKPYQKEIAQNAAHAAVANPFEVSDLIKFEPNEYADEVLVPAYTLPDPLKMQDGTPVRNRKQWMDRRRPELLKMFAEEEYGSVPLAQSEGMHFKVLRTTDSLYGSRVKAREIAVYFTEDEKRMYAKVVEFLPADANGPVPVFLGMNFKGNHTVSSENWVSIPTKGERSRYAINELCERGSCICRDDKTGTWDVEKITSAGFGFVTYFYEDVCADYDGGWDRGVYKLFSDEYTWKAIGCWAWSLSRVLDYLETDPDVDASKVAVFGHSRLGKAALWAAALDQRFAMVISNESGCGGAALYKRHFGETAEIINIHFPYWFCDNFWKYNENEASMPFDQHELLSLIAPRPLYVACAQDDLHSDPCGEQIAAQEAAKVYKRFWGPKASEKVGYHCRQGRHGVAPEDWDHYIDFANRYLK